MRYEDFATNTAYHQDRLIEYLRAAQENQIENFAKKDRKDEEVKYSLRFFDIHRAAKHDGLLKHYKLNY